jgi:hypothetical protein
LGVHGKLDSVGDEIDNDLKEPTWVKDHPVNTEVLDARMRKKSEIYVLGLHFRTKP